MHLVTVWRREKRKSEGKTSASSGRKVSEEVPMVEFMAFACAVVGQLHQKGRASFWDIKTTPSISDGTDERKWFPCPENIKEAITSSKYNPKLIALAAADLGQLAYRNEPVGISSKLRAVDALIEILEYEGATVESQIIKQVAKLSPGASSELLKACMDYIKKLLRDPEEAAKFLGLMELKRHFTGLAITREASLAASPLHQIMERVERDGSLAISRRIVCYYRQRNEFAECKNWLLSLIGRDIAKIPLSVTEARPLALFVVDRPMPRKARPVVINSIEGVELSDEEKERVRLRNQAEKLLEHSVKLALESLKPSTTVQTYAPPRHDDQSALDAWDSGEFADDIDSRLGWSEPKRP